MKFSTREDIEAPIDHVFAEVSNFAKFERRALRLGAQVERVGEMDIAPGAAWAIKFKLRGRERKVNASLTAFEPPETYQINAVSDGLNIETIVDLVALSPHRTRLIVAIDLRPRSLTARVFLQSMKLAKGKLTKRFKARVLEYAEDIADDYRKNS